MENLGIYCAGGLGKEVLDLAIRIQSHTPFYKSICFIDDNPTSNEVNDIPVLSFEEIQSKFGWDEISFVIAAGEPYIRELLSDKIINAGYLLNILIAPTAIVSSTASIADGTIIFSNCIIGPDTIIGENSIIHSNSVVSHDSTIGNHCMLCPGTNIAGQVTVGNNVFFGIGSNVKNSIHIGDYAIIGMGAVAVTDTEKEWILMGNPARRIGINEKKRALS